MMFATFIFYTKPTLPELVLVLDVGNSMLLNRSLGNKGREEEVENRESARLDFKDKWIFFQFCLVHLLDMAQPTPQCSPVVPELVPA